MGYGRLGQISAISARLSRQNRFVDMGVKFVSYKIEDGIVVKAGSESAVYGGIWDVWAKDYCRQSDDPLILKCSEKQLELVLDDSCRIEGSGGRGSGKSEGGVLKCIRRIVESPHEHGQIVSPTFRLTKIVWAKMLSQLRTNWLKHGAFGIRRGDRELNFVNEVSVRFVSSDNPDGLRSWGGSWAFLDEEQDITNEAVDIIWPSLRLSSKPQMWSVGTPKSGDYLQRHKSLLEDEQSSCFGFNSYSNPFVSHNVFHSAKKFMDEKRYRQEILADWDAVELEDVALVFPSFSRDRHCVKWPVTFGLDITEDLIRKRIGYEGKDIIIGVDYNWNYPNYAVVFKVIADVDMGNKEKTLVKFGEDLDDLTKKRLTKLAISDTTCQRWVAIDVVTAKGHAGHLANAIIQRGYNPRKVIVIDDASGEYNEKNVRSPNSSSRLMRQEGITVVHPTKNPGYKDAVNAILSKLSPVIGDPTLYFSENIPECDVLIEAVEHIEWHGERFEKSTGFDHIIDAMKYPIAFFSPIRRIPINIKRSTTC